MEGHGHYSPDGRWWWNGSRWAAVSEMPARGSRPTYQVVLPILSALVIMLVVGAGVFSFVMMPRLLTAGLNVPGSGGGVPVANVTSMLRQGGFECSLGYTKPTKVWFCFQTRAHDYTDVGIQVRGKDEVGWAEATVDRNQPTDPDVDGRAKQVFRALAAALAGPGQGDAADQWAQQTMSSPGDVGSFGNTQMRVQKVPDAAQQPMYEFDASVANTQKASVSNTQLKDVDEKSVQSYFEQRGLTCSDEGGVVSCATTSGESRYKGIILPDDSGAGVRLFYAGVLPGSGDRTPLAKGLFEGAVRVGIHGADADKAVSWVNQHLDGKSHDVVINGVHVALTPESPGRTMRQGGGAEVWLGSWPW